MNKEKVAGISILANITLASGKIAVGLISNSTAVLAAGLDSLVDIFSSFVGYLGIKISNKPADEKHPYGHHKFEVLSGAIITLIVLVAGIGVLYEAYQDLLNPEPVGITYLAIGVMVFSVIINEIMARLKTHYGKKENSISLLSDGAHSRIDVYTSLAILIGLFLTPYWIYADAVLALIIGLYIIKEGSSIGKEAVDSLLDVSAGREVEEKMKAVAQSQNIDVSSLKTQRKGSAITANLEIELPSNLKVDQATQMSESLREELMRKIENLHYVAIQIKSHEVATGFYKPGLGKGFGWQKRVEGASGRGPLGSCVCEKCGYKATHKRGTPCSSLKCPNCNLNLTRE